MLRRPWRRGARDAGPGVPRLPLLPEPEVVRWARLLEVHGADGECDEAGREVLARRRWERWERWRCWEPSRRRRRRWRRLFLLVVESSPVGAVRDDERLVRVQARLRKSGGGERKFCEKKYSENEKRKNKKRERGGSMSKKKREQRDSSDSLLLLSLSLFSLAPAAVLLAHRRF